MRIILLVISSILLGNIAFAESISLKHEKTGKVYGPFELVDGGTITLGKATFTIVKESTLKDALTSVIIEEANFKDAAFVDVLSFLRVQIREALPEENINFIFMPGKEAAPTLTLNLSKVNALDLLKFSTELSGAVFELKESAVIISRASAAKE